jgi:hypothetical protein
MAMRDFKTSRPQPLDQADGLRRLFAASRMRFVPVLSNPHLPFCGVLLERLCAAFAEHGLHTLLVDAGERSPEPHELAALELGACVETLSTEVSYLAARGLPIRYVDTQGSTADFLSAVADASPHADVVLVHAGASDLARLFVRRPERTVVLASDHPASVTHAYGGMKILNARNGLKAFDLLLAAAPSSPRVARIAEQLSRCADDFLGAVLHDWADIDPATPAHAAPGSALRRLVRHTLHRPPVMASAADWPSPAAPRTITEPAYAQALLN